MSRMDDDNEEIELGNVNSGFGGKREQRMGLITGAEIFNRLKEQNTVQKVTICLIVFLFAMLIIIMAIASAVYNVVDTFTPVVVSSTYPSLGLPDYEGYSWADVTSAVVGKTVHMYSYVNDDIQNWYDDFVIPNLLEVYDINFVLHDSSAAAAVTTVKKEIARGDGMNNGTIDLIWINGANFYNLKSTGEAYGPWANKIPSAANFDFESNYIKYDFGYPTQGFEMPYNGAQVVFIRNGKYVNETDVRSIPVMFGTDGSGGWLAGAGLNKFTYPAPCSVVDTTKWSCEAGTGAYDYTGSVFIRHIFYYIIDTYFPAYSYEDFQTTDFNEDLYKKIAPKFFTYLRAMEANLYQATGSMSPYTTNISTVDELYRTEAVHLDFSYNAYHAQQNMEGEGSSLWDTPALSKTASYLLTSGTIGNTNYLAIPSNAPNKLAAVVAANYIASAAAQFSRANDLGYQQVYNPSCDNFVAGGWNDAFEYVPRMESVTPTDTQLSDARLGEVSNVYTVRLEVDWYYCVKTYGTVIAGHNLYCV